MKKPQEIIGDFIRLNSDSLNNMQKQAPEVAKAFAEVIKLLAVKYGNVPIPTTQTTSTPTGQYLEITKEMMLGILGDVIQKDEKLYVIDEIQFIDEFGDAFSCNVHLTELSKKRRKTLEFKIQLKMLYYIVPYGTESNNSANAETTRKLEKESEKEGFVVPLDSQGKKTNIHNILSSMPYFKFKINGKAINQEYSYYRKNEKIVVQKQKYTLEYGFVNENNSQDIVFISLQDIVDYLFNFEFNAYVIEKNKSKKVKCESLTYLIPVLINAYTALTVDYREEFIGMKIFFNNDLTISTGIGTRADMKKFWEVIKITDNKRKRKAFELFHPETKETKSVYIDLEDLEKLVRNVYSGLIRLSGQNCLVQTKYDDYTIQDFFAKLRTYSEFEWQGVTNPYIYSFQNLHYDSDRFELRRFVNSALVGSNNDLEILNSLKTPVYFENILKEISFQWNSYNDRSWIDKMFYLFNDTAINYKGREIFLNYKLINLKIITYLATNTNPDSFYNKFERKLQDLPIILGDCFMYKQNFQYPEQEAEIYIFKKFENKTLYFEYRPGGKNVDYETKSIDLDKFVKDYYVGNSQIFTYKSQFYFYYTEKVQEFLVGEKYPIVINGTTQDYKITRRKTSGYSIIYTLEGGYQASFHDLSSAFNPQYIKEGDDVIYIGDNISKKSTFQLSNNVKRIYLKSMRINLAYGMDLSSFSVTIALVELSGDETTYPYEYLFDFEKPSISQILTNTTQQPSSNSTIIENLEVYNEDFGKMSWDKGTEKVQELGEGWRLPTIDEFENILYPNKTKIPNLKKDDIYWSSSEGSRMPWYFYFTSGGANIASSKGNPFYVRAVRDLSSSTTSTTQNTYGLKIGDDLPEEIINKWVQKGENYYVESEKKWKIGTGTFVTDRKIESFKIIDGVLGFFVSGSSAYLRAEGFKEFLEEQTNKTTQQTSTTGFKQRIATIPETLSKDYNISYNLGDRTGPSQSASELRVAYENTQYENELKNTYFVGNDGNWYRLKEDSRGRWTWKKDEPPVQTSTINKQYNSMSQSELKQRYKDIQEAMAAFDEDDEEYKELKLELETLDLYIE